MNIDDIVTFKNNDYLSLREILEKIALKIIVLTRTWYFVISAN
ncbi:MAG: hypothetical protein ACP5L4_05950 [Thermoplasmata archaeon]